MKAPAGLFSLTPTECRAHILAALFSVAFCTTVSGVTPGKMIMTCSAHPVEGGSFQGTWRRGRSQ